MSEEIQSHLEMHVADNIRAGMTAGQARREALLKLGGVETVKEEYRGYLDLALPLLRTGGVVICDNLLWGGQVAGEIRSEDQKASTEALREFNHYFVNHPQLRAQVLAVGDGLGYGVKIE